MSEEKLGKKLLEGHVDPVRLRQNIQRIRENIETVREGFGSLVESRPVLGALRDFRRRLRQWRSMESRSQPVYTEELEAEQPSEKQEAEQEKAGEVKTATVSPERLPPRLIVRERPRIRRPGLIQSLREYVQAVVEERKLETEYQKFRLQLLKKQAEQPVRREEKAERQGFHV